VFRFEMQNWMTVQIERYSDSAFFWNSPVCRTCVRVWPLVTPPDCLVTLRPAGALNGTNMHSCAVLFPRQPSNLTRAHHGPDGEHGRPPLSDQMRAKTHRIRTNTAVCMELHVRRDAVPAACALKLISWQDYAPSMIALRRERCADASAPAHCNIVVCAVWVQNGRSMTCMAM
jgi:hypothetical protein